METNEKVAVIISTYNGEKYLKEQIDSILEQTYKNIDIYIRDDGSKDKTLELLELYEERYINIFVTKGENVGYAKSFYKELEETNDYDYYAFCDQDDKWHEDKIENAINLIKDNTRPICVFTEYNYCNEKLVPSGEISRLNKGKMNFRNSLVEASISGNTTLFNNKMKKEILKLNVDKVCCHDWLLYMIGSSFGEIIYDKNPSLEYRRTGNNTSPRGVNFTKLMIYRIKKIFIEDYLSEFKKQIIEFNNIFNDKLSKKDKKIIRMFVSEKYNFFIALKKTLYIKRFRQTLIDDLLIRFMFLIGKL